MKRILLVVMTALMLTPAWADVEINEQTFPDANFRNIVSSKTIDKDRSGTLSDDEIASVTSFRYRILHGLDGAEVLRQQSQR